MNWLMWLPLGGIAVTTFYYMATCSETTREERSNIYENLRRRPYAHEAWEDYESVSFDRHLWAVATMRDPRKLYGQEIAEIMGWSI